TSGHGRGRCREPSTILPVRRQDRQQPERRPRPLAKSRLPRQGADAVLPIRPAAAWKSAAYGWKQSLFGPYPFHRQPRSDYLSALLRTPALNLVQPRLGRSNCLTAPESFAVAGLARLRGIAQVWLRSAEARVPLLRLLVRYRTGDDDVPAGLPVDRGRDRMLRRQLHRVEDPQHLVEIAPGRHRIGQHRLDLFVRPDNEDRPYRRIVRRRSAGGCVARFGRQHVVELRDFELGIADQRVSDAVTLRLLDVL